MAQPAYPRTGSRGGRLSAGALCAALLVTSTGLSAQTAVPAATNAANPPSGAPAVDKATATEKPKIDERRARQADQAYLNGAKKLDHDDLDGAEREFRRALALYPENRDYAIAISVVREHRLTGLVQQSTKARQSGDNSRADTLLAAARAIDPTDPLVLEHSYRMNPAIAQAAPPASPAAPGAAPASMIPGPDRAVVLSANNTQPWKILPPVLAGPIRIEPSSAIKSFTLRGSSRDVIRNVLAAYGMRAVVDDSVDQKAVRFDIDNVNYAQATYALTQMTHTFLVPLDETTLIVAKEDATKLRDLQRQMQETIEVPGSTPEQLNELANVVRTIFSVSQATAQPAGGTIVVRAPQDVLDPLNRTLQGLLESSGEVMLEVKIYEIDTSNSRNIGATIPTQFTAFNVNQEATSIVESNQTLVQEAIAQGYISATASDLEIALALIGSGLVQNTLASNLIGTIGGGLIRTGISGSTNSNFNLSLNTTDNRSLDDVQLRTEDHQEALFREGTRYPVTSSTYSTGLSTAASALSNATINGVSVANLLSQYAGGTSATIPQVTYEDLGVTLKVTPVVQRSDRVNLKLDLKIEALAGGSANGIPVLANRQFASDITLKDGESALLASNVTKNETAAMTGLPGISELPGFQLPTDDNVARDTEQLVVVVTPHIVRERNERFAGPRIPVPNDARK